MHECSGSYPGRKGEDGRGASSASTLSVIVSVILCSRCELSRAALEDSGGRILEKPDTPALMISAAQSRRSLQAVRWRRSRFARCGLRPAHTLQRTATAVVPARLGAVDCRFLTYINRDGGASRCESSTRSGPDVRDRTRTARVGNGGWETAFRAIERSRWR